MITKTISMKKINAMPYQFAFHDRVPKEAPQLKMWHEVVESNGNLTREQKDRIFLCLQSNSGNGYYRLSGWVFPFAEYMKTFLVKYEFYGWQEIKAFDKTCIRKSYYTNSGLVEIIEKL